MIGYCFVEERKVLDIKMKNQQRIKENTLESLFYNSLGLQHFAIALSETGRLLHLDVSENDIGCDNFRLLLAVFTANDHMETINLADCKIDGECVASLCQILKTTNQHLKLLKFRNSNLAEKGADAVASLIEDHKSLMDLEIFNC